MMKIPIVLWSDEPPSHSVTCIAVCSGGIIVTGSIEGQIVFWFRKKHKNKVELSPKSMIVAHSSSVEALVDVQNQKLGITTAVISLASNQELCLWNSETCCCLTSTFLRGRFHSLYIVPCRCSKTLRESLLVCYGYQNTVILLDPFTLQSIYVLYPQPLKSCIETIRSVACAFEQKEPSENFLALTHDGALMTWSLPCSTTCSKDEKPIKIVGKLNRSVISDSNFHARFIYVEPEFSRYIILCSNTEFRIYSFPNFELLKSHFTDNFVILGGVFISSQSFVIYFENSIPRLYVFDFEKTLDLPFFLLKTMNCNVHIECASLLKSQDEAKCRHLFGCTFSGKLFAWDLSDSVLPLNHEIQPIAFNSLLSVWAKYKPRGIAKHLTEPVFDHAGDISCSLQLQEFGFMIFGLKNGTIIIASTIELLVNGIFGVGTIENVSSHVLTGHIGAVTCLCHPYEEYDRHNPCHLVSGGVDCTVRLWNLINGTLLKTYIPHGGLVQDIFVFSNDSACPITLMISTVALDYSVSLINLALEKEILTARCHTSLVYSVKWLPRQDYLLVYCTDGTLFVWEVTTGHLERCVCGKYAIDIFQACDENQTDSHDTSFPQTPLIVNLDAQERIKQSHHSIFNDFKTKRSFVSSHKHNAHLLSSKKRVIQSFFRRKSLKNRNTERLNLAKDCDETESSRQPTTSGIVSHHSSACNLANLSHNSSHSAEESNSSSISQLLPFGVIPLRTGHHDSEFHVVLIDFEFLVSHLISPERADNLKKIITPNLFVRSSGNFSSSFSVRPSKFPAGFNDAKESISHIILTLGLSPAIDCKSYGKYCQLVQNYHSYVLLNTANLLVSSLHPWNLNADIDTTTHDILSLPQPMQPINYGFMCRHKLQLTIPGWSNPHSNFSSSNRSMEHWQISSVVSSQHLIALLSLTDVLMSVYNTNATSECSSTVIISSESGGRQFISTSVPDLSSTQSSASPRTRNMAWSKLRDQHYLLISKLSNQRDIFLCPSIHELVLYWLDTCSAVRNSSYQVLISHLRHVTPNYRSSLVRSWSLYLPTSEEVDTLSITDLLVLPIEENIDSGGFYGFWPSDRRFLRTVSIFLISFVICEFPNEFDPLHLHPQSSRGEHVLSITSIIILSAVLFKALRSTLDIKKCSQYPIRKAFLFFLGRQFTLWQPHLNLSQLLTSLLESCASLDFHLMHLTSNNKSNSLQAIHQELLQCLRSCLKEIMLAQPEVIITVLNKDLAKNSSNTSSFGHSGLVAAVAYSSIRHHLNPLSSHPSILQLARGEVVSLIELIVSRKPAEFLQLALSAIDLLLNCSAHRLFKKDKSIFNAFPFLKKLNIIDYCDTSRRLAVGTTRGQIGLYDIKNLRCTLITSFGHSVTCLKFSLDGKQLVAYSHEELKLCIWNTQTSIFGIIGSTPKPGVNFHLKQQKVLSANELYQTRLYWINPNSFKLIYFDGHEFNFTL